jgi:hypothetical protein
MSGYPTYRELKLPKVRWVMDDGHMKFQKNGRCLDMGGNEVLADSPDAHIPIGTPMTSPFAKSPTTTPVGYDEPIEPE